MGEDVTAGRAALKHLEDILAEHLAAMIVAEMREEAAANAAAPDEQPRPRGTKFRVVKGHHGPELTLVFNAHTRRPTNDRESTGRDSPYA